jgi:GT2 family glycosyltransferase
MKLSFIVLTHHRGGLLQQCLDSITMQQGLPLPYEIIIVDNGGDAYFVLPTHPDICVREIVPGNNLWVTGGRNYGIKCAQGEYLVFIDDDAHWTEPDAVKRLIAHLDADARCGAVAVKSLHPDGTPIVEELPHPNKVLVSSLSAPAEVPYFYGVGMAIRADALRKTGLYPERFRVFAEEVDLSLRLIEAGYRIVFDPNITVIHCKTLMGRPFVGDDYWRYNALNKTRVAWRLLPHPYSVTTLLVWSAAVAIKTRKPRVVWQVWRDLWAERRLLTEERRPIQPKVVAYLKRVGARLLY